MRCLLKVYIKYTHTQHTQPADNNAARCCIIYCFMAAAAVCVIKLLWCRLGVSKLLHKAPASSLPVAVRLNYYCTGISGLMNSSNLQRRMRIANCMHWLLCLPNGGISHSQRERGCERGESAKHRFLPHRRLLA
jgi:hypothetical protein